jgi:hypothetical protein
MLLQGRGFHSQHAHFRIVAVSHETTLKPSGTARKISAAFGDPAPGTRFCHSHLPSPPGQGPCKPLYRVFDILLNHASPWPESFTAARLAARDSFARLLADALYAEGKPNY